RRPEDLRELPARQPPHQLQLEQPLRAMEPADGEAGVRARLRPDLRHPLRVEHDLDRRRDSRRNHPVVPRHRPPQIPPPPEPHEDQQHEDRGENPYHPPHHAIRKISRRPPSTRSMYPSIASRTSARAPHSRMCCSNCSSEATSDSTTTVQ